MIIQSDFLGLYVNAGNWVARPVEDTKFEVGRDVQTYHFAGQCRAGIGKVKGSKRGEYQEYWMTTGIMYFEYTKKTKKELQHSYDYYKTLYKQTYGLI